MSDVPVTAAETPVVAAPAPEATEAPKPTTQSLADLIREDRASKAERARVEAETATWKIRAEKAEEALGKFRADREDLVMDPVGYMTSRELSKQELAVVGETLLYSLVPEKANAEQRSRMVEAQVKRAEALAVKREAKSRADAEARQAEADMKARANEVQAYAQSVAQVAKTWSGEAAHPFPVSGAWFAEEPEVYHQSLVQTAANLARAAQEQGTVADLSPRNVASVLEAHLAKRAGRLPGRTQAADASTKPVGSETGTPAATQAAVKATIPVSKPTSERAAELARIERAKALLNF